MMCSQDHLRGILAETEGSNPTNMVMLPNGGILLMSLRPYEDTNGGYFINHREESVVNDNDNINEHVIQSDQLSTTTQASAIRSPSNEMMTSTKVDMDTTTEFVYPEAWKDTMPKFGVIPRKEEANINSAQEDVEDEEEVTTTQLSKSSVTTEWTMPVFPFGSKKISKDSEKPSTSSTSQALQSSTTSTTFTTTTKSTVSPNFKSKLPISLSTLNKRLTSQFSLKKSQDSPSLSKLFNNEIDVHKPKFKIKKPLERSQQLQQTFESTFIPISSNQTTSKRNLTDLYERLKSHYIQSQKNATLRKKYRIADDDRSKFDNVNVVVPGNQTFLAAETIVN